MMVGASFDKIPHHLRRIGMTKTNITKRNVIQNGAQRCEESCCCISNISIIRFLIAFGMTQFIMCGDASCDVVISTNLKPLIVNEHVCNAW